MRVTTDSFRPRFSVETYGASWFVSVDGPADGSTVLCLQLDLEEVYQLDEALQSIIKIVQGESQQEPF